MPPLCTQLYSFCQCDHTSHLNSLTSNTGTDQEYTGTTLITGSNVTVVYASKSKFTVPKIKDKSIRRIDDRRVTIGRRRS